MYEKIFKIAHFAKVEFHPYRTANSKLTLLSLDQDSDAGKELVDLLVKKAREDSDEPNLIHLDNHICFSFGLVFNDVSDENKLVVKVSDSSISIGVGLERGYW